MMPPIAARWVASCGGVGYAAAAPGTAGSLAAVLLGAAAMQGPPWLLPVLAAAVTLLGLLVIPAAVTDPNADPGWVVIDEVAGQWIALLGLGSASPLGLLAAFALFRALDIAKPGPVGWADRRHGATGIMLDDVLAGMIAAALLWGARWAGLEGLG
jgi:phosphatidylglycerophosphatase A